MHADRITQLKQYLEKEPNDPFLLYALATEYLKTMPATALDYYEKLLKDHSSYVPTYYHAAALYAHLGMQDKAKETYIKGIETARQAGDTHALRELQSAYNLWEFEQEED